VIESTPLVSIIMNCYNGEKYLREAIDSIYAQTYQNWEIVFWDNLSTDNSAEIAKSYDHRLRLFCSEETTPLGQARIKALENAQGEYVSFLDVDDLWLPNMLKELVDIILNTSVKYGFVYGRVEFFSENISPNFNYIFNSGEDLRSGNIFKYLCKENFIPWPSVLIDHDKLLKVGGFPSEFNGATDFWIFLNLSHNYPVGVTQNIVCKARFHDSNLSRSQWVKSAKESIKTVENFLPEQAAIIGMKYQYIALLVAYIREGSYLEATRLLLEKGGFRLLWHRLLRRVIKRVVRIPHNLDVY